MRKAIFRFCFLLLLALQLPAYATGQAPDRLLIDGEMHMLDTNPLAPYLAGLGERRPRFDAPTSALWRGYVATWELREGRLLLKAVDGFRKAPAGAEDAGAGKKTPFLGFVGFDAMAELFPQGGEVFADWYTGALVVPLGEPVEYAHMGYETTYARYIVSLVHAGVEVRRHRLSLDEFSEYRRRKFEAFRQTDAYRAEVERIRGRGGTMTERNIEDHIRQVLAERYMAIVDPSIDGQAP